MKKSKKVRSQIKSEREKIPKHYQQMVSFRISELVAELKEYRTAKSIAAYVAIQGECDPKPLLDRARQEGKTTCLAKIVKRNRPLMFGPFDNQTKLVQSGFGLFEPDIEPELLLSGSELDLVILPMVGFDDNCNRLGMGGGYYDRTFEFLKSERTAPTMVGIAYEQQKLDAIETNDWDVPLDYVVTELQVYRRIE